MHPDEAVYKASNGLVIAWIPLWQWNFIAVGAALPLLIFIPTTAQGMLLALFSGAAAGLAVAFWIDRRYHGLVDFHRHLRWMFKQGKHYLPATDLEAHPLEVSDDLITE